MPVQSMSNRTAMEVLRAVCLSLAFIIVVSASHHSDEHHGDAFESILETMKVNESLGLSLQNLTAILKRLGVHNCSNKTDHHHKCVTATALYGFYNISNSSTLKETEFGKIATVILYSLLPAEEDHDEDHDEGHENESHENESHENESHEDEHEEEHSFITKRVNVHEELLERYTTRVFCQQILEQVLKDLNESTGDQLTAGECFSSHDIFHELNVTSEAIITKENFPDISTVIISKLLKRQCINIKQKDSLPCPTFFVNELFEKFSENGSISEKGMKDLLKKLKIGGHSSNNDNGTTDNDHDHDDHDDHDNHDGHDGHDHRRRRRSLHSDTVLTTNSFAEKVKRGIRRHRRATDDHEHKTTKNKYEKCYSANELFTIFNVNEKEGLKVEKFQRFSPALLHQVESNICAEHAHEEHDHHSSSLEDKYVWGYGILAVAIVSLCSVFGVVVIPLMGKIAYQKTVVFLIALAVGTLVGDALLHLIPHATGFHNHDHDHDHGGEGSSDEDKSFLWKFLVAIAGIYGFFLFETITHLFLQKKIGHSHSFEHTRRHSQLGDGGHKHRTPEVEVGMESYPNGGDPVVLTNVQSLKKDGYEGNLENEKSNISEKSAVKKSIATVAWMIIIGDTIHNIADGIAIGVAFTDGQSGGISTSLAVFFHELPHELGDFAVLLSAGMTVKQALLANFLSACSCFIGLVAGILIGDVDNANQWIFAVTAGFFIYIALTDMLPELMHSADFNQVPKLSMFLLQNAGILTGFGVMILLAYYEEDIRV